MLENSHADDEKIIPTDKKDNAKNNKNLRLINNFINFILKNNKIIIRNNNP
jgi:hypothetical protein